MSLAHAHKRGSSLLRKGLQLRSRCITKRRCGALCNSPKVEEKIGRLVTKTAGRIASRCTGTPLQDLVAVDSTDFSERAEEQARCLVATVHSNSSPFTLDCGPRPDVPVPPRGQDVQIVLDEAL